MKITHARTAFVRLQRTMQREYRKSRSYRVIARLHGVSVATARRVILGYEPKADHIRRALGLPVYATVQVCPHCGKVHPPSRRHVSSNPALLKFIREVAVPFLAARDHE